jgi:hypothetical protein
MNNSDKSAEALMPEAATERELNAAKDSNKRQGGAEGDSSSADKPAGLPAKDDPSPLGDTDQHSS